MPKVTVDGVEIEVAAGMTVLQAAEMAGAEIPRFCYHERLAIAGNCRMCLVYVENMPKPVASCAMPINEGMVIETKSERVQKARKGVMELLLINHPLDCPICDQGGECDLQDQALFYGMDRSRYHEEKRASRDKDFGPLIETEMTRCIQCTRCVRFMSEVAGVPELGAIGRGEHMEIVTYLGEAIHSELSGNLIDLCPVGALTNKPAAYTYRSWELTKTESIDVMDALGANIRIDSRGNEVIRILPRINDDVNEEWLSDLSRFACDGLKNQRLDQCYVRNGQKKLEPASWNQALQAIAVKLKKTDGRQIGAIAGDQTDLETMVVMKDFLTILGSKNFDCRQDGAQLETGNRSSYLFNSTIAGIDEVDVLLMVGVNPRFEAPVLNARIRKRWLSGQLKAALIGESANLNFKYDYLGDQAQLLVDIANNKHPFSAILKQAKRGMIIIGEAALTRPDGAILLGLARKIVLENNLVTDEWNGFNVLHRAASRVGGLDVGFVPPAGGTDALGMIELAKNDQLKILFLLGADEIDLSQLGQCFVVYIGSHGDAGAGCADVILPTAAYTEKTATYVNIEGRVAQTTRAVFPVGEAIEDWLAICQLARACYIDIKIENIAQLRHRIRAINPLLAQLDEIQTTPLGSFGREGAVIQTAITQAKRNFYLQNPISRASKTMGACAGLAQKKASKENSHQDEGVVTHYV